MARPDQPSLEGPNPPVGGLAAVRVPPSPGNFPPSDQSMLEGKVMSNSIAAVRMIPCAAVQATSGSCGKVAQPSPAPLPSVLAGECHCQARPPAWLTMAKALKVEAPPTAESPTAVRALVKLTGLP